MYIPQRDRCVLGNGNMQILQLLSETANHLITYLLMASLIWIYIFTINIACFEAFSRLLHDRTMQIFKV